MAQNIIPGSVKDDNGFPLEHVQIYSLTLPDSILISRQLTGEKGEFNLIFQHPGIYQVQFKQLGYQTELIRLQIDNLSEQIDENIIVTLTEKPLDIPEVTVNFQRPIRALKDTIEIRVNSYLNGGERVVEDVLKRLPGLEVDANGGIRVRGKPVSRVLIEGDDLFENQYALLTRNLDAGTLDKVQVLYKYTDNPVLRGIRNTQEIALNISLKPEIRNTFFGQSEVGGGSPGLYTIRPNLINVRKATKTYFIGNLNNIGLNVKGDLRRENNYLGSQDEAYLGSMEGLEPLWEPIENFEGIAGNRFNMNQSSLGSLSGVINPLQNLKIQGNTYFNTERNKFIRDRTESIITDSLRFNNSESGKSFKGSIEGDYQFKLRFNPKNRLLEWESKGNRYDWKQTDNLLFGKHPLQQMQVVKKVKSDNRLTYTQRWNNTKAFQLNVRRIYETSGLQTQLDTTFWSQFPTVNIPVNQIRQVVNQGLDFKSLHAKLLGKHGNWNWKLQGSILTRQTELKSNIYSVIPDSGLVELPSEFSNRLGSRMYENTLGMELNYSISAWKLNSGLERQEIVNRYSDRGTGLVRAQYWVPNFGFEWSPSRKHTILARYAYSVNETGATYWHTGYLLSGYRGLKRGGGWYIPYRAHSALLGYTLGEWGSTFQLHTNLLFRHEPRYLGLNLEMTPRYQVLNNREFKNRQNVTLGIEVNQYFKKLYGNLKTKINIHHSNYQIVFNQSQSSLQTSFFDLGPEWRTLFNKGINLHLGYALKFSTTLRENNSIQKNEVGFLDLNLQAGKKWFLEFSNELYRFHINKSNSKYWFSDLLIRYAADSGKPSFRLELDNLWNVRTFSTGNITDTGFTISQTRLRPRSIVLAVNFRF